MGCEAWEREFRNEDFFFLAGLLNDNWTIYEALPRLCLPLNVC